MRSVSRNKTTTKNPTTFASLLSGQENSNFSHLRQQSIQESSALCPQDSPQAHLQIALPWGFRFHHRNSGATQTPKAHVDNGNMQKELCLNFPLECKLDHHLLWKASSRTGGPVGKLEKTSSRFTVNESCMFDQVRVMQYSFRGRHRVKDYFLWAFFGTWHLVKRTFYSKLEDWCTEHFSRKLFLGLIITLWALNNPTERTVSSVCSVHWWIRPPRTVPVSAQMRVSSLHS